MESRGRDKGILRDRAVCLPGGVRNRAAAGSGRRRGGRPLGDKLRPVLRLPTPLKDYLTNARMHSLSGEDHAHFNAWSASPSRSTRLTRQAHRWAG